MTKKKRPRWSLPLPDQQPPPPTQYVDPIATPHLMTPAHVNQYFAQQYLAQVATLQNYGVPLDIIQQGLTQHFVMRLRAGH